MIKDILSQIGTDKEIAEACGVAPIAVKRWGQQNSIPAKHLYAVIKLANDRAAGVTYEQIAKEMAANV